MNQLLSPLEVIAQSEIFLIFDRDAPTVLKVATTGPQTSADGITAGIFYIGPGDNKKQGYLYVPKEDARYKVVHIVQKNGVSYIGLTEGIILHLFQDGAKLPSDVQFQEIPFNKYLAIHLQFNPR